jgi:hypothetical protein
VDVTNAERAGQGRVSQPPISPSPTDDPLTRLWRRADGSHGHHLEAVAELRERKRREQESRGRVRRQYRRRGSGVPDPRVSGAQSPSVPVVGRRIDCDRCNRTVEQARSDWVAIPSPAGEPHKHLLCSRCADEVRRGLLRLLAGQDPLPAPGPEEQWAVSLSISARAGRFAFRMAAYGLIGLAVFTLVTWLVLR